MWYLMSAINYNIYMQGSQGRIFYTIRPGNRVSVQVLYLETERFRM